MEQKKTLRKGHPSAFPQERRIEIGRAMRCWYLGLSPPKDERSQKSLGASNKYIHDLMDGKLSANPKILAVLWRETNDPVFLLSPRERATWCARGFAIPDELPFKAGEEEMPLGLLGRIGSKHSVFTDERLAAISEAIASWVETVPAPKVKNVPKLCGASLRAIDKWRRAEETGCAPRPEVLFRFWQLSKSRTFLLNEAERLAFTILNEDLPLREEFPATEAAGEEVSTPAGSALLEERRRERVETSQEEKIPAGTAEKTATFLLASMLTIFMAVETQAKSLPAIPPAIRRKAAELIIRIGRSLQLKEQDFKPVHVAESDPAILRKMGRILGKLGS